MSRLRIDPKGCRCTDCILGHSIPFEKFADYIYENIPVHMNWDEVTTDGIARMMLRTLNSMTHIERQKRTVIAVGGELCGQRLVFGEELSLMLRVPKVEPMLVTRKPGPVTRDDIMIKCNNVRYELQKIEDSIIAVPEGQTRAQTIELLLTKIGG